MMKKIIYPVLLVLFSSNSLSGETDQSATNLTEIEAVERQQIIKELTYRLVTKENCNSVQVWTDQGSGADQDGYFFLPSVENNYFIIGGFGTQSRKTSNCVITVSEPPNNPEGTPKLLVPPADWKLIWTDKGSGADTDGSMWGAVPPNNSYRCLGSIPQKGYKKPAVPQYRCVHNSLTEKATSSTLIWSEKGSNADKKVSIFGLPNSYSFVAAPDRLAQIETYDLMADPVVKPNPKKVEKILAERMEKIQQGLEASVKSDLEQKKLEEKAEQQRLAEAARQKELAAAAEQQKLDQKKQEQMAEQAEQKRLAEAAAEQQRLAEAAAEQPPAEMTEEQQQEEVTEPEPVIAEVTSPPVMQEDAATESMEHTVVNRDDDNSSGGFKGLLAYLLKITLAVFVLFLILGVIIYKSVKGSGNKAKGN